MHRSDTPPLTVRYAANWGRTRIGTEEALPTAPFPITLEGVEGVWR
jgi:hypothetical protein